MGKATQISLVGEIPIGTTKAYKIQIQIYIKVPVPTCVLFQLNRKGCPASIRRDRRLLAKLDTLLGKLRSLFTLCVCVRLQGECVVPVPTCVLFQLNMKGCPASIRTRRDHRLLAQLDTLLGKLRSLFSLCVYMSVCRVSVLWRGGGCTCTYLCSFSAEHEGLSRQHQEGPPAACPAPRVHRVSLTQGTVVCVEGGEMGGGGLCR